MKERLLYWTPRLIGILAVLFMMMFSIDCMGEYSEWKKILLCFLMHNIPAFIVLAAFVLAWIREYPGGLLLIIMAVAGAIYFRGFSGNWGVLIVMAPFLVAGILFIIHATSYQVKQEQK